MLDVVRTGEQVVSLRVEFSYGREQSGALFLGELSAEGVDGDVDGAAVGFEGEDAGHELGRRSADGLAEGVEVLEVGFVECVADDLDVEVVQVGGG